MQSHNNTVGIAATDFSFKQAYVVLRAPVGNGIDFKIGTFDTCIGYEVFDGPANPNYSRSDGHHPRAAGAHGRDGQLSSVQRLQPQRRRGQYMDHRRERATAAGRRSCG